ncbi:MAG: sulfotransferase [Planctomycetota bacterium]
MLPIVVFGCYRSGSSLLARLLHEMGVDMGAPFHSSYFEPNDLAQSLRVWWCEPELRELGCAEERVVGLSQWLDSRRKLERWQSASPIVGAKHPLLTLCLNDIAEAWGKDVRFIWAHRSLDESVKSLSRVGWWMDPGRIQETLYSRAIEFFDPEKHLQVSYDQVRDDPSTQVRRVAEFVGANVSEHSVASLAGMVFTEDKDASPRTMRSSSNPVRSHERSPEKLVATMLSGNCEHLVGDAIQSVKDLIDELVLIDTGITDSTVSVARELLGDKLQLSKFVWIDDFGDARNAALRLAEQRGAT